MAKTDATNPNPSLQNFTLNDGDDTFFGINVGGTEDSDATSKTIQEVKKSTLDAGEDEDDETVGKLDDEKADDDDIDEEEDTDFFGTNSKKPAETTSTKKKTETAGASDTDDKSGEEEDADDDDTDDKTGDDDDKSGEGDDKFYSTLATELKEKGIFQNVELKEGEEITEEKFFELQDEEIEKRVDETFEQFFEQMDEDAKAFLKFKKDGGKTADFFGQIQNTATIDFTSFDVENEAQREAVLRHHIATVEGLEGEELTDRLQWIKDGGKDKTYAEKFFNAMKKKHDATVATLTKQQEDAAKAREQESKDFNASLNEVLEKTEQVGVFPIKKSEQKELGAYITKPTVKVGKNRYVPEFQVGLAKILKAATEEDKQKLILLGKLIKNDFDVKDLATKTQTAVVKKVKSKLQEAKNGTGNLKSGGGFAKKSLTDYFS